MIQPTRSCLAQPPTLTRTAWVCAVCLSLGPVTVAHGQSVSSDGSAADTLNEVVVSAEKRESTVQKTPVSITALTGADLQARGVANLLNVAQETPGVSFRTAGPGQTEYEIRGLTSSGGFSPTVGFYLDDAPLTAPAQSYLGKVVIDPDLYDLNRVEVLRGPQGTLYGAGSMGGTIKLITNRPKLDEWQASALVSGSKTQGGEANHGINAMLNVPLVDNALALRIVGTDKYIGGWIDRIVLNPFPLQTNGGLTRGNVLAAPVEERSKNVNGQRIKGARASLQWQVGDNLSIAPSVLYQRIDQGGPNTVDDPPGNRDAHYLPFDIAEPYRDSVTLYTLPVQYSFSGFDLSVALSKWKRDSRQIQEISEPMQALFGFPSFYTEDGGIGGGSLTYTDSTKQTTQEVRLASTGDSALQWLVGAYHSNFDSNTQFYSRYAGFEPLFGTDNLGIITQPIAINQKALFGELSYRFLERFKATVGLRHYSYTTDEVTTVSGLSTASGGDGEVTVSGHASSSGNNPKFGLSYTASDDLLLYLTASKGFRPGAGNQPVPLTGPPQCLTGPGNLNSLGLDDVPKSFGPDSVWSYEFGEKLRLADRRVVVNGDVYYQKWSKVQQQVSLNCGFFFTANASDASIYGAELEIAAKVSSAWSVNQSLSYTHASFDSTAPGTGIEDGDRLLNVPRFKASTSVAFRTPLSEQRDFVARASYSYSGAMQDLTYTRNDLPGYSLVSTRFGLETEKYGAFLYVDNVMNKFVPLANAYALSVQVPSLNRVVTNLPRTYGLELRYNF